MDPKCLNEIIINKPVKYKILVPGKWLGWSPFMWHKDTSVGGTDRKCSVTFERQSYFAGS